MTLSKPVSVAAFVSARFFGLSSSIYLGLAAGSAIMYILTTILIGYYDAATFAIYMSIIGLYLVYVASLTFFLERHVLPTDARPGASHWSSSSSSCP